MIMTIGEFYSKVSNSNRSCNLRNNLSENNNNINISEDILNRIIKYLASLTDETDFNTTFQDIINKSNWENGKIYEVMVYVCFQEAHIPLKKHPMVLTQNCLKENSYEADGLFENIYFDIKKMGIELPLLNLFKERLQEKTCSNENTKDYTIIVQHNGHNDTRTLEKKLVSQIDNWYNRLFSDDSKLFTDYYLKDNELGITIRAYNKNNSNMAGGISSMDASQWAEKNEFYFMYHGSQFVTNTPYMLICPYMPQDLLFANEQYRYWAFRFLCRRMFMNLKNMTNSKLKDYDGKAKNRVTISEASQYISGVMFLDISKEWNYENCNAMLYCNPNAKNKIPNYISHNCIHNAGAIIDDFRFDNY